MNDRQRFHATMHYEPRDRAPICDFGFWPETIQRWKSQGLPGWVGGGHDTTSTDAAFGMDTYLGGPGVNVGLCPTFETRVIEDRGDHELVQQHDGVRVLRKKWMSSIPHPERHLLEDRASWEQHYKPRLDPDTAGRYPDGEAAQAAWEDPDFPVPRVFFGGSLFGRIRDWMGVEAVSYLVYDDPALFEEMVTTLADLVVEVHRRAFEQGARIDACHMWEDMCYSSGPLLSPGHFKQYLVPHYRRITGQLRDHGCDIVWLDCDGNIADLVPLWLEAGVNTMFPLEIGTWKEATDPVALRAAYGKDLRLMGGFDKHILAEGKAEIEAEVDRLTPLVEEGGYIGFADHRVPPDVSLENYLFYLEQVREQWGKGVNLKPMKLAQGAAPSD